MVFAMMRFEKTEAHRRKEEELSSKEDRARRSKTSDSTVVVRGRKKCSHCLMSENADFAPLSLRFACSTFACLLGLATVHYHHPHKTRRINTSITIK